jgi:hypothetical protein
MPNEKFPAPNRTGVDPSTGVAETILRVIDYLDARLNHPGLDRDFIHCLARPEGPATLLASDLHDLVRRALLVDSLDHEVSRLGERIAAQARIIADLEEQVMPGGY